MSIYSHDIKMNLVILLAAIFINIGCSKDPHPPSSNSSNRCIDTTKINPDSCCFTVYEPVCGCDSITYSNACEAQIHGLLSWKDGACDPADQNFILNGSFECDSNATFVGWFVDGWAYFDSDSIAALISQDAPPGGGNWCFKSEQAWCPENRHIETYITGQSGTNIYQLKVWMKSFLSWKGVVSMGTLTQFRTGEMKLISAAPITWTQYTLTDTLTILPNDTIKILFASGGCSEGSPAHILFDLVELRKL